MKFKRLFFDIEVSYDIGSFWGPGRKVFIDYHNIIKERAVICICWRWEHQSKIHSLKWGSWNGSFLKPKAWDDKAMLRKFIKVMNEAHEIYGHNSDQFDIKWLRTRCLFHRLPMWPEYKSVDTYKQSRSGFRFNSNRLDYIGKFLGVGKKLNNSPALWDEVCLMNNKSALEKMVRYCKQDVVLVQNVAKELNPYVKAKTHVGVLIGQSKISCPECGGQCKRNGIRVTAGGTKKQMMTCNSCGKYHTVLVPKFDKVL